AERGSQLFVNDTLDLRGDLRPAAGATLDYAYKDLVVLDKLGDEHGAVVRHQLFAHLGGSFMMLDRYRVGLNLPVAIYPDDVSAGSPLGSEIAFSGGGGLKALNGKLVIGPELFTSTVFTDSRSFFKTRGTPTDWLFGLHCDVGYDLRAGAGVGGGITTGYGS